MRTLFIAIVLLAGLSAIGVHQRHNILLSVLGSGEPPPLLEKQDEGSGVDWVDDYFIIDALDERTFAIGEPRYHQQVFSYLILGTDRAILFDAGPGYYDVKAVAESLTDLPITFIPSHFHFDHTGNEITFENIAVVDLPYLRERARNNRLPLTQEEHLGSFEGVSNIVLNVDEWIAPGSEINLGDRTLRVLLTPGHTEESISLFDAQSRMLFSGDFIYPGPLFAFLPNSSLPDYVQGAEALLSEDMTDVTIYGAHRVTPPGTPKQSVADVKDLHSALIGIRDGDLKGAGLYPVIYPINEDMQLWAEPKWLQDWASD